MATKMEPLLAKKKELTNSEIEKYGKRDPKSYPFYRRERMMGGSVCGGCKKKGKRCVSCYAR